MYVTLSEQSLHQVARERQRQVQAVNLAARLAVARKWERRAAAASRRARLARAAVTR